MESNLNERKCPVCQSHFPDCDFYEYIQCGSCKSYVYISDKTAEDDNRDFYNSAFASFGEQKFSNLKKKLFRSHDKKDKQNNKDEHLKLSTVTEEINSIFKKGSRILEVGFGEGRHLFNLLESGYDAYGIDVSEKQVGVFGEAYPQYKERVRVGTSFDEKVDIVYCSALLEHLDDPREFISNIHKYLTAGGFLIINAIPILNESKPNIDVNEDISFWKPCHRIIPSHDGFIQMFSDMGYALSDYASIDIFNYKLLSLHIRKGYDNIVNIRHSCVKSDTLPNIFSYFGLCREALSVRSSALVGMYVFRKR